MVDLSYRSPKAEVRASPIHGKGLFAKQSIAAGEIVAVTKVHHDAYKVYAPFGLDDLFAMLIRRNPVRVDIRSYNVRLFSKQYDQRWRSVKIIKGEICQAKKLKN